jgi:hypothetical protein
MARVEPIEFVTGERVKYEGPTAAGAPPTGCVGRVLAVEWMRIRRGNEPRRYLICRWNERVEIGTGAVSGWVSTVAAKDCSPIDRA